MHLSTKTALAVVLVVGVLAFGLGHAAETLLLRSFGELEATHAQSSAIATKQNLLHMVEEFRRANQDWAEWDEVADYLAQPSQAWADENLAALSFQMKGWSQAAIVDDHGRGWSKSLGGGGDLAPPSPDFVAMLTSGQVVFPNGSARRVSGFASIDGGISMFFAEPLRVAGKVLAVPGAFVATQRIDDAWQEKFRKLTSTDARVVLASGPLAAEEKEVWAALERGDEVVFRRPSDTEIESYVSLEDHRGERIGFIAVREESTLVVAARGVARAVRFGLIAAGAIVSIVSVLMVRLGILSRLRSLNRAIRSFGRGELASHDAGGTDEIGDLASAFVEMRGKLIDRERGISENAAAVRLVLDHTGNGVVSVTRRGSIVGEVSRAAREWLGEPGDLSIADYLFRHDAQRRAAIASGFEQLSARSGADELIVDRLPRLIEQNGRRLEATYLPIEDEGEEDIVLVVLRDVTEAYELSRREAEARELHNLFARALRDRSDFSRFLANCNALLTEVTEGTEEPARRRALRSLRDQCAVYGVETVTAACRELEEAAPPGSPLDGPALDGLPAAWRSALSRFSAACPRTDGSPVFLAPEEHRALVASMSAHGLEAPIVEAVAAFEHAFSQRILGTLAQATYRTATRLEKDVVVRWSGAALRIDQERTGAFWSSLVHVVRNAVDHGIEASADEREAQGKPRTATIDLSAELVDDELRVVIRDDGAGIDWERVADKARARRMPHETREDLVHALFAGELSTKDEVTELSGRGVGLSAVRAAIEGLGGNCRIESTPGAGSAFVFSIPAVIGGRRVAADPLAAFAPS